MTVRVAYDGIKNEHVGYPLAPIAPEKLTMVKRAKNPPSVDKIVLPTPGAIELRNDALKIISGVHKACRMHIEPFDKSRRVLSPGVEGSKGWRYLQTHCAAYPVGDYLPPELIRICFF